MVSVASGAIGRKVRSSGAGVVGAHFVVNCIGTTATTPMAAAPLNRLRRPNRRDTTDSKDPSGTGASIQWGAGSLMAVLSLAASKQDLARPTVPSGGIPPRVLGGMRAPY